MASPERRSREHPDRRLGRCHLGSEGVAIGPRWAYLLEFLTGQIQPWDRGVLDAHLINAGPTSHIQRHLRTAAQRRQGFLALVSPWRRRYLDGLAWALEQELERRSRERR